MYRYATLMALAVLIPAAVAQAQFQPGDWEVTVSGSGFSDETLDGGTFNVDGSIGYFIDDRWEVSLRQGLGYTDLTNDFSGSTRVALDYHFDMDQWQPFVGVNLGYVYGGQFRDTWAAGPEAGVKYFVNDTTFVYGSVAYDFFFRDAGNINDDFKNGQFVYGVGIGFRR